MRSLRTRIALAFVGSTALVVCLATIFAMLVINRIGGAAQAESLTAQLRFVVNLAEAEGPKRTALVRAEPDGIRIEKETRRAEYLLHRNGIAREVTVTQLPTATQPTTWIKIASGGWLAFPTPGEPPPPEAWLILTAWMGLILLGMAGVAFLAARRLTRPLRLLESFASGIGPNGEMTPVPEEGPLEVRATARALNRLNTNLQKAVESRVRLVAAAGHDLRTPLTRMRLRAEFLEPDERDKWLKNIQELDDIADGAIQLVTAGTRKRADEIFALDALLAEIAEDLDAIGHRVDPCPPPHVQVRGDRPSLKRAILNLVSNAATHGSGARVELEHDALYATIRITDCGPGIPEHLLAQVFEPFFRIGQARTKTIVGAGLGMAISREIVDRAGGTITIANDPSGGLRQEIVIPNCRTEQKSAAPDTSVSSA